MTKRSKLLQYDGGGNERYDNIYETGRLLRLRLSPKSKPKIILFTDPLLKNIWSKDMWKINYITVPTYSNHTDDNPFFGFSDKYKIEKHYPKFYNAIYEKAFDGIRIDN